MSSKYTPFLGEDLTLEQKFTYLLAQKLKGNDIKSDMDALSEEELVEFKKWIAEKKEAAEYDIWKQKRIQRAKDAEQN